MEKETSYIEKALKNISSDKSRMLSLIFSTVSAICTLMYVTTVGTSGIHLVFVLSMLVAAVTTILYSIDTDSKIKHINDIAFLGVATILLGSILKVVRVGINFSLEYLIGYLLYSIAFLLTGLCCVKTDSKTKIAKILLLICAVWSVFEFFYLSSQFLTGIVWKMFRISEAFLAISYFFFLNIITKEDVPFKEKLGNYKQQIPTFKICIVVILIISIISGSIGAIINMGKGKTTTVITKTVSEEKTPEKKEKKSTVTSSTVIPAEEKPTIIEEIKTGDTIETDSFSLKLNKVEISRRVEPNNPPSYYTYYQAEADHTYIYINASVTNKEKHALECDEIYSVTADFDGGYEYKGFNIADDSDGDFTYANITSVEPLETLGVHCLVDCPQIVEEDGKPLFLTISLKNGSKYKYIIK